ncbi:PH domain-containing protein [Corynebacterium sp. NPDC060344]|uniref:PH domain-containing protein n=1 Tax=Corynebacterium sp. NPDC060344 TaxID=3347101 RepID=UPI0036558A9B
MSTDRPSTLPTTRFRPQKTHFMAVVFLVFLAIVAMGFSLWLTPLLLVPVIYSVWILRVRTTVSSRGITAVYLVGGRRSLPWNRFRGVLFDKRGRAFAVGRSTEDGQDDDVRFSLPAITFNSLPALSEATGGRIPDPVTPAHLAEGDKVEIFDRDGNSVKMTREEYEAKNTDEPRHP